MNATEQRIDDRDKSIDYSEPFLGVGNKDWSAEGGLHGYMNTTSLAQKKGASAKLTFTGSSVAVYGMVSPSNSDSGTTSQYYIDGTTSGTYTTQPEKDARYDVKFFQSDTLKHGRHTLEVVNETKDGWLWLDYFVVLEGAINSTSTNSTTAASASSTSTMSSVSSTPSSDILSSITSSSPSMSTVYVGAPSSSATASSDISGATTESHHASHAGVIIGAIFGGIFGIMLIVIMIWLIRRKLADRFADEAAAIPVSVPNSFPNVPVKESKVYPFSATSGGIQTSSPYQNHTLPLPPPTRPQLQPRSRPDSSHNLMSPVATPDMGHTQTDVFSAGNQRQSSYIPPPAYSGPPGL